MSLQKYIFCNRVGYARMVEKSTCEREDAMPNASKVGLDDEIIIPKAVIKLVDEVVWGWGFYWHYSHR